MDVEQLKKFFRLLGSEHDGEALAALRAIKNVVEKEGKTWNQFIDMVSISGEKPRANRPDTGPLWEAFRRAAEASRGADNWEQAFNQANKDGKADRSQAGKDYARKQDEYRQRARKGGQQQAYNNYFYHGYPPFNESDMEEQKKWAGKTNWQEFGESVKSGDPAEALKQATENLKKRGFRK